MTSNDDIRPAQDLLDYRALFQAVPLPTFVWRARDGGFFLIEANRAADAFTAGRAGRSLGMSVQEFHKDIPAVAEDLQRCLEQGDSCAIERPYSANGGGRVRHMRFHYSYLSPDLVMTQILDVTARQEAEEARKAMERVSRHDLKSPLNIVVGVANLLKEDANLEPQQRECLQMIEDSGYAMLNIINVSLDILRIERGEYRYAPRPLDLLPAARRVAGLLRLKLSDRGLALDILADGRPASDADTFILPGDAVLWHCLLETLVRVAAHLAPAGSRVRLFMDRTDEESMVGVRFLGQLPPETMAVLRDKFVSAPGSAGACRSVYNADLAARTMGGRLEVLSRPGETVITAMTPA